MGRGEIVDLVSFLTRIEPFNLLAPPVLFQLASRVETRRVKAKEFIFLENETGDYGYIIVSGRVALLKSSPNGKDLIVELLGAGEPFGIIVLLEKDTYPLSARAQIDSTVIRMSRSTVQPLLRHHPELHLGLVTLLRNRLRHSHNLSRLLAHEKIETRVASILLTLCSREGGETVTIGRGELANLCGITIESASRIVKNFEKDGLIKLKKAGVIEITNLEGLHVFLQS